MLSVDYHCSVYVISLVDYDDCLQGVGVKTEEGIYRCTPSISSDSEQREFISQQSSSSGALGHCYRWSSTPNYFVKNRLMLQSWNLNYRLRLLSSA